MPATDADPERDAKQPSEDEIAELIESSMGEDPLAAHRLSALLYSELERLAQARMAAERPNHTLAVHDLVGEACRRLLNRPTPFEGRSHFLALGAKTLRQVLVDHERQRRSRKRDLQRDPLSISNHQVESPTNGGEPLMSELLEQLLEAHPQHGKVVMMKFLGGMTEEQIASALSCTDRTVRTYWRFAKAWLRRRVQEEGLFAVNTDEGVDDESE